jgi:hypothetical protein
MIHNLVLEWLDKGKELLPGEEYHFAVANADEQARLIKDLRRELKKLAEINPVEASKYKILKKFRDHQHYVHLQKVAGTPLVAFKKDINGKISRVSIELKDRTRRLFKMMLTDGLSEEEIIKTLGRELSDEERRMYVGRRTGNKR